MNIDHLLIGPGGVFVLETKNLHGTVVIDGDQGTLTRPGGDRPDYRGDWWQLAAWLRNQPIRLTPEHVERLRAALEPRHRWPAKPATPAA